MLTFKFLYTLGAVTLGAVVYGQQSDGAPCIENSDCISRLCTVPFAGPGDKQCIGRPAPDSASCSKDQEATDCDSGYCLEDTLTCGRKPRGTPCSGTNQCDITDICAQTIGNLQGFYCLETGLGIGAVCNVNEQCASNNCLAPIYECREPGDTGDGTAGIERPEGEACENDAECASGVCDDLIANDGFKKVCLKGPSLPLGLECSTDRQCFSQYCVPQSAPTEQKPLTCAERPADNTTDSDGVNQGTDPSGGTDTSAGGQDTGGGTGENTGGGSDVFTTVIVENGQTRTEIATRTITVRGSSSGSARASASTTRVSANASSTSTNAAVPRLHNKAGWYVSCVAIIAVWLF